MSDNTMLKKIDEEIRRESSRIDFFTADMMVETIHARMDRKELFVPTYQREFRWKGDTRSRFIESLLLRMPVPFVFLWEADENRLEIVDGSQRLRTVHQFISNDLVLGPLERIPSVTGRTFEDLPQAIQRRLLTTPIRTVILNEAADIASRKDFFNRINTSSEPLTSAETRSGTTGGKFNELIVDLKRDPNFQAVAPMTPSDRSKQLELELITRFFAYSNDLTNYRDNPRDFVMEYTRSANAQLENDPILLEQMRNQFAQTMQFVHDTYPMGARRTPTGKKSYNARFEAVMIGAYKAITKRPELIERKPQVMDKLHTDEFDDIVSADGANVKSTLMRRIRFVENVYLDSLG